MKSVALIPKVSEKTYMLASKENVYTFSVRGDANKLSVKDLVEDLYSVTVQNVRMQVRKGKKVSSYRKGNRPIDGYRAKDKIAYVRLKDGDTIPNIFEEVE